MVLIESLPFVSALGELLEVGIVSPGVPSPERPSALPPPLSALAPPPTVVTGVSGSFEVRRPSRESIGFREQATPLVVAGEVVLSARLAEGDETKTREGRRLESALLRADAALETIECMLSGFKNAISIAQASVAGNFVPFGQVSISFVVSLSAILCSSRLFVWSVSLTSSCSIGGSGGGAANGVGGGGAAPCGYRLLRRGRTRARRSPL
jgi:hypothetical protein